MKFAVALTVLAVGCQADPEGRPSLLYQPDARASGVELAPRVFVVDAEPGSELGVSENALTFYAVAGDEGVRREPGDLLVGSRGEGFLRVVDAVEDFGDEVTIQTHDANLDDMVVDGTFSEEFRPFQDATAMVLDEDGDGDGLVWRDAPEVKGGYIKLNDTKLVTDGGLSVTMTEGHVNFDPSLHVDADFTWTGIERFEVIANGRFDAAMGLRFESDGYHKLSHKLLKLWESPKHVWVGAIGPVPVVVVTQLELGVDASLTVDGPLHVDLGAGMGSWVSAGAVYDSGQWSTVGDREFEFNFSGPEFVVESTLDAKILLDGKLKVNFYDLAGPWVSLKPGVKAGIAGPEGAREWYAELGVEGKFGGAVKLPFKSEIGFEGTLFAWWHRFAEGTLGGGNDGPGQDICGSQAPFSSDLACNGAQIAIDVDELTSCIQHGGGGACLTSEENGAPVCGAMSGGGYTCDMNALFSCLCWDGGVACVDDSCTL